MTRPTRTTRLTALRAGLLALGIAGTTFAAAQSAPDAANAGNAPGLGPAFSTRNAAYAPVPFEDIPGWDEDSFDDMADDFANNCKAMKRRAAWAPLCNKLARIRGDAALRAFLLENFYAYQMLTPARSETGKLTGYFEPLIAGSLRNEGPYRYPIYGVPKDMYMLDARTVGGVASRWLKIANGRLVGAEAGSAGARNYTIALGGMGPNPRDKRYRVRIDGNTVRPYYTRKQIDAGGIDAPVLAWVADPFKLYSMQIQGSGKIQLKDGGLIRLAYAEQNGHPFMPNATRGDSDAMLLAIKARALQEPPTVEIPGGTRGARKAASGVDAEVADIIAALQGGKAPGGGQKVATAKPKPRPKAASRPRPASQPQPAVQDAAEEEAVDPAVQSAEVEAMIALLLNAPVADTSEYVPPEEEATIAAIAGEPSAPAAASSKGKAKAKSKPGAPMDMSQYESVAGNVKAGQAVGAGKPVPATGIHDPSFVFFRRIGDGPEGPIGALGVPLAPGRSMAVDPRTTPLGAPVFLDGKQPGNKGPMRRLVFAQDTGGAIRGSVRGDFFWGFGDKAGKMALATNHPVRMWLLLPKSVAGSAAASGMKTRGAAGTDTLRDCVVPDEEFCVED